MNHPSIFTEFFSTSVDAFLDESMPPYTGKIVNFEKAELKQFSIPIYYQHPEKKCLFNYKGICQEDFFPRTSIEDFFIKINFFLSENFLKNRREEILSLL